MSGSTFGVLPDRLTVLGARPGDEERATGDELWVEVQWYEASGTAKVFAFEGRGVVAEATASGFSDDAVMALAMSTYQGMLAAVG